MNKSEESCQQSWTLKNENWSVAWFDSTGALAQAKGASTLPEGSSKISQSTESF
jgi:hypothetical protein